MNSNDTLVVYKDEAGEWRWRLEARNGKILADSGEGYTKRSGAERAARRVFGLVPYMVHDEQLTSTIKKGK
jgi:uncharacterized protein YegP (UPF0339 family)